MNVNCMFIGLLTRAYVDVYSDTRINTFRISKVTDVGLQLRLKAIRPIFKVFVFRRS